MVTTRTSRYFLDLDTRQVMRHPGGTKAADPAPIPPNKPPRPATLRGDGDVVALRSVGQCRLGEPLVLYLDLRGDGVVTIRQSTEVTAIEQVLPLEPGTAT